MRLSELYHDRENVGAVLYHGTERHNLATIEEEGLHMGEGWGGAGTNGVFLSGSPEGALYWAKQSYSMRRGEKAEHFDRHHGEDEVVVLEVNIPVEFLSSLKADMEQAEDVGFDGSEDDWERALEEIGDVRFDGPIPPEWIGL